MAIIDDQRAIWEVNLRLDGPITVRHPVLFDRVKGGRVSDPFYSEIEIRRKESGVEIGVTANAVDNEQARKAAILFVGRAVDVLACKINQPLWLQFDRNPSTNTSFRFGERRRVEDEEWQDAFDDSFALRQQRADYLRGLSWYRKGLITEDPFDRFLALWNSIEIIASKYHPAIPEGRNKQTKSQIWESFKKIWGECEVWPIIPGQQKWIDNSYDLRKTVAHGVDAFDVKTVDKIAANVQVLGQVAHKFITDYRSVI
jgi:hypothetical protein